ncbi:cytochrome c biogenesis CcdA family protein [Microbacterium sp. NPDC055910]|uniref:cytochrome c biogenesis CcdA family protein n=1 Tax=Microbacterium sp. NPDC055910 TaxID=3345659 RepID=UPI0035DF709F
MNPAAAVADGSLLVAVPIAILAGLISFLSPCVLPLVPGYLGFIAGAAAPRRPRPTPRAEDGALRTATETEADAAPPRGRLLAGVLLFIAGFAVVFMALNFFAGTVGIFFLQYADVITRILGVVVILLGLVFIGVFGFAQRIARPQVRGNIGLVGAPLLGLALGIGWAPCIGPTLAVILNMSFDAASAGRGALLGLAYSLGLGIPFVLLTLGFGWATRSVSFLRRHIRTVNIIGGVLLILVGLLMVTGVWSMWMAQLQGVFQSVPTIL